MCIYVRVCVCVCMWVRALEKIEKMCMCIFASLLFCVVDFFFDFSPFLVLRPLLIALPPLGCLCVVCVA